jgi:hypothetical protein
VRKPGPEVNLGGFGYQADSKSPTTGLLNDLSYGQRATVSDWLCKICPIPPPTYLPFLTLMVSGSPIWRYFDANGTAQNRPIPKFQTTARNITHGTHKYPWDCSWLGGVSRFGRTIGKRLEDVNSTINTPHTWRYFLFQSALSPAIPIRNVPRLRAPIVSLGAV